jgi:hypothetical protein
MSDKLNKQDFEVDNLYAALILTFKKYKIYKFTYFLALKVK